MRFVYDENESGCIWRADYNLTTTAKTSEALSYKASEVFLQNAENLCDTNQTLAPQGFSVCRPDSSDSVGRWFEASRAYQVNELRFSTKMVEKRSSSYPQSLIYQGFFL